MQHLQKTWGGSRLWLTRLSVGVGAEAEEGVAAAGDEGGGGWAQRAAPLQSDTEGDGHSMLCPYKESAKAKRDFFRQESELANLARRLRSK